MSLIYRSDEFHERRINALADRMIAAIKRGEKASALTDWPELRRLVLSRSPAQVARMERRMLGRAA